MAPLAAYWALLLLRFVPAAMGAVSQPAILAVDALSAIACSVLSLLWYFVWFGSIQFGLIGRFPLLSVRSFSILLGGVYFGFGIFAYLNSKQSIDDFSFRNQEYLLSIFVMLLLSALGIVFLPKLNMQADKEDERLTQERDQRLDQLYPWIDSRSGESNQISTNNPIDRSGGALIAMSPFIPIGFLATAIAGETIWAILLTIFACPVAISVVVGAIGVRKLRAWVAAISLGILYGLFLRLFYLMCDIT